MTKEDILKLVENSIKINLEKFIDFDGEGIIATLTIDHGKKRTSTLISSSKLYLEYYPAD